MIPLTIDRLKKKNSDLFGYKSEFFIESQASRKTVSSDCFFQSPQFCG